MCRGIVFELLQILHTLILRVCDQVIHMDLKTKNVLLNREQTVAKVTDVGLSRGLQSSATDHPLGTLEYCAPEVLLGRSCSTKVALLHHTYCMLIACVCSNVTGKGDDISASFYIVHELVENEVSHQTIQCGLPALC